VSFILDALRKSEHERQRSTVPGLTHVPLAAPRRELPGWALAVIGMLAAAVLVLAGAWWQSRRPPAVPTASAPVAVPVPVSAGEPTTVAVAGPTPTSPPPPVAASSPAPPAPSSAPPPQPQPATHSAPEPRAGALASAATAGLDSPARAPSGPTLPSVTALQAQGISVPPLRLELHAYSDVPADRFVFINGRKYLEGQRLAEGPEVVTIERNGVVLSQQGQRFMLAPE
jgi:general secretion pathway protein B